MFYQFLYICVSGGELFKERLVPNHHIEENATSPPSKTSYTGYNLSSAQKQRERVSRGRGIDPVVTPPLPDPKRARCTPVEWLRSEMLVTVTPFSRRTNLARSQWHDRRLLLPNVKL